MGGGWKARETFWLPFSVNSEEQVILLTKSANTRYLQEIGGWQEHYHAFMAEVKAQGIRFHYWTLGPYRVKNAQLDAWCQRWGLLPM